MLARRSPPSQLSFKCVNASRSGGTAAWLPAEPAFQGGELELMEELADAVNSISALSLSLAAQK